MSSTTHATCSLPSTVESSQDITELLSSEKFYNYQFLLTEDSIGWHDM